MKLNLYSVSDKYINYLRQFDERIYDNKEDIRTQTRKYLGIVLTVNDFNYYIPMSSPKKSDYIDYEKKIIINSFNICLLLRFVYLSGSACKPCIILWIYCRRIFSVY